MNLAAILHYIDSEGEDKMSEGSDFKLLIIEGLATAAICMFVGFFIGIFVAPKTSDGQFYCNVLGQVTLDNIVFGNDNVHDELEARLTDPRQGNFCHSAHVRGMNP